MAVNTMDYSGKETVLDVIRKESGAFFKIVDDPMNWNVQTRCTDWQVRDMVGHMLDVTEGYLKRWENREDPDKGKGVGWEAHIIRNLFYALKAQSAQFIPILLQPGGTAKAIPLSLREHTHYFIADFDTNDIGYENLLRHLTDQAATPPPAVGSVPHLPPRRP